MIDCEQLFFSLFSPILVPRALRFLVTWFGNEGMWKQPLPDVRKFLTSSHACAEVTNITAHAHNGFLSLTAHSRPQSPSFVGHVFVQIKPSGSGKENVSALFQS